MDRLKETFDETAYASLIVLVIGYIFTISGHYLFSEIDPDRWGGFGSSALSVFYLMLLQDVPNYVSPVLSASKSSILYFLLFYFVIVGLFISTVAAAVAPDKREQK